MILEMLDRLLCSYLRKRGWIVFWLEEGARHCGLQHDQQRYNCWLALYLDEEQRKREGPPI